MVPFSVSISYCSISNHNLSHACPSATSLCVSVCVYIYCHLRELHPKPLGILLNLPLPANLSFWLELMI